MSIICYKSGGHQTPSAHTIDCVTLEAETEGVPGPTGDNNRKNDASP
jgi:hypothetical protein